MNFVKDICLRQAGANSFLARTLLPVSVLSWFVVLPCMAQRKLIATGWDSPNAAGFRKNAADFEKWPFDGVTLFPTVKRADGTMVSNGYAFSRDAWAPDACREMIADLQASHSRLKAQSFLFCYSNPGDVDWFDDAGWNQVVDHWRQLARAAHLGGLRGLLFDAEPYTPPYQQFNDTPRPGSVRHTQDETRAIARVRGRQVMRAVASEFPDAVIFSYRLLSDLLPLCEQDGDPRQALSGNTYALLPAFVDGWLDAAPPTVTIIEGDEDIGYRANSAATFDHAYARLRNEIPALLDPANARKYRNQVLISHGIYLDAYANPPGSPWYIDPMGAAPSARLGSNVASAFRAADSNYVWIYGEMGRWWPARDSAEKHPLWPQKLPGADAALLRAKDPVAAVHAFLKSAPPAQNLLKNTALSAPGPGSLPSDWWTWQEDKSHGTPSLQDKTLVWTGAEQGVFGQNVPVKPGARYAVCARIRHAGNGSALITIGWKNQEGKWSNSGDNLQLPPRSAGGPDSWSEACGLITAPEGSATMILMFAANGQTSAKDRAQFRDLQCFEMP